MPIESSGRFGPAPVSSGRFTPIHQSGRFGSAEVIEDSFLEEESSGLGEIVSDVGITVGTFIESAVEDLTFGIAKPDIISEQEERENPYASKVGHIGGSVAGFVGSMLIGGLALKTIPITKGVFKFASIIARQPQAKLGIRAAAGAAKGALLGGFHGLVTETVNQVREQDPSLIDIGVKAVEEAVFFGITGGVNSLAQFQPRIARGLADGTAFATSTTLLKLARGEVITSEDVVTDFMIGTAMALVLSPTRFRPNQKELDLKVANELRKHIENIFKMDLKSFTKETNRILGDDRDVSKVLVELFKSFKKQIVNFKNKSIINQKIVKQNTFLRNAPQEFKKEASTLKQVFSIEIKKVPGLEGAKKRGKLTKVDKVQRKEYEQILQDSYGVKTTKDLTFGQLEYALKELKQFNKAINNGRLGSLDVSDIKSPGLTAIVTPGPSMINAMHAQGLVGTLQDAVGRRILYLNKITKYATYLDKAFLDFAKVSQSRRIGEAIKGKRHPELTKLMKVLSTKKKDLPKLFATMTDEQVGLLKEYRAFYDAELYFFNLGQKFHGKPEIKNLDGYIRWRKWRLDPPELTAKEKGGSGSLRPKGVAQVKEKLSPEFKKTKKEIEFDELLMTPAELLVDMVKHNTMRTIIEAPLNQFKTDMRVLGKNLPRGVKDYLVDYVNHALLGHPKQIDILANATIRNLKIDKLINFFANKMSKDLGASPIHTIGRAYGKTMNAAWISFRVDLGIRNYTQRYLSLGLVNSKSYLKAMVPNYNPALEKFIISQDSYQRISGISYESADTSIKQGLIGTIARVGHLPISVTHKSNVFKSMKASGFQMLDWIQNPKHYKVGFASSERIAGKTPPPGSTLNLWPSELKWLKLEVETGGRATQYDYSSIANAPFMQSATGKAVFKFWSWPVNYTMNYWREMLTRSIYARPSYAGPNAGIALPLSGRIGPIRHVAFSSAMIGAAEKAGIDLSSVGMGLSTDPSDIVRTGPLPDRGTHLIQLMQNLHTWTSDRASPLEKKKAFNSLNYFMNPTTYLPGSAEVKKITKAIREEDIKPLFFRPLRKK